MLPSFFPKEPYFCSFTFLPKLRTLHFVRVSLFVYYKHQSHENVRKMPTYKQNLCCIMKMRQGIRKSCPKKYMMLLVLVMWHFILKRKAESDEKRTTTDYGLLTPNIWLRLLIFFELKAEFEFWWGKGFIEKRTTSTNC